MSTDRAIAPGMLIGALVGDWVCHKAGLPTVSSNVRMLAHTETPTGKIVVGAGWLGFSVWVLDHWLAPRKQHHVK